MSSQRLAAIAAISQARQHYNYTQPQVVQSSHTAHFAINVFLISIAFVLALMIIFIAFWLQDTEEKRTDTPHNRNPSSIYTITGDLQECMRHGCHAVAPPPSYSDVISEVNMKDDIVLEEVVTGSSFPPVPPGRVGDNGLPSYEAAIMLRDTKV